MATSLIGLAETREFQKLFIAQLHWAAPDHAPVTIVGEDGTSRTATNVSSYAGIRVWVCHDRPGAKLEAQIDRALAKVSTDRIVIFHTAEEQVWRWPVRRQTGQSVSARLTSHRHRNGQPNPKFQARLDTITLPTDQILDANTVVAKVRAAFDVETQNETKHASQLMARMYSAMETAYPANADPGQRDHDISLTLARILFLMFGDDTEMWRTDAFRDFIHHHTAASGKGLTNQLDLLFTHLNTAVPSGSDSPEGFKYVNGGIFAEHINLPLLGKEFRDVILQACAVDWSTISPAIFGSMFQSVRDADARRKLGEHYTSETNILKTLNPLFLDDLRADLAAALVRDTELKQINALNTLWRRLGDIRFMDPACGCGNFIIVAYRELRDLELQVMEALLDRQHGTHQMTLGGDLSRALRVTLDHFYGIEIDEWPARIAETAMYLIDRQCDLKLRERFGEAPERLPIQTQSTILVGDALRIDWASVVQPSDLVYIAGNPPFVGARLKTKEQATSLAAAWGDDYHGDLDLVTGWYAKANRYYKGANGTWAFVSTNSVCQGAAVPRLFGPLKRDGWTIKFAYRPFVWDSEAAGKAAVHCVIVGMARTVARPRLFEQQSGALLCHGAEQINAYLVDAAWVLIEQRRVPLSRELPPCDFGSMPNDDRQLRVSAQELPSFQADPVASNYLRPFVGSENALSGETRWCLWMVGASIAELSRSARLTQRLAAVRRTRAESTRIATQKLAKIPHLFGEIRQPKSSYLCIPRHVSEARPVFLARRLSADIIADSAVFTAADEDGFAFSILSSAMFITWQRTVGGRIKSDLRFSNTLVWNTLPLAPIDPHLRREVAMAGRRIEKVRDSYPNLSLAQLYATNALPDELAAAHRDLDTLVDQAFGATALDLDESARQKVLFSRYAELNKGN